MTVSTAGYYEWWRRGDSLQAPYNACSPNLVQLMAYYKKRWGAVSLGCHNERPVRGGTKASTHSWGAALDPSFPSRTATIDAMNWTVAVSAELGVNAIHDYETSRIWYPSRGWHTASIQSGSWIHVETLPDRFADNRPIEDRLPGSGAGLPFPPPIVKPFPEGPMTPADLATLTSFFDNVAQRVWAHDLSNGAHGGEAGTWVTAGADAAYLANEKLQGINLEEFREAIIAAATEALTDVTIGTDNDAIATAVADKLAARLVA